MPRDHDRFGCAGINIKNTHDKMARHGLKQEDLK
jgi:hypothetical protein